MLTSLGEQLKLEDKLAELLKPVSELREGLLVSAIYDGDSKHAVLKFYDPRLDRIWRWEDNTGHLPYCYSKLGRIELEPLLQRSDVLDIRDETKLDLLEDTMITVRKIVTSDPLAVGGSPGKSIRDEVRVWEADIKYYENYVYDRGLRIGTYYTIQNGSILPVEKQMPQIVANSLNQILSRNTGEQTRYIRDWADLLSQPLCSFKRIALDIEVENEEDRVPDPEVADRRVIAISFYNENESVVYLLAKTGDSSLDGIRKPYTPVIFTDEASMLRAAFSKMMDYPFLVTFNGDDFDLRYLVHRAKDRGVKEEEIPVQLMRQEASLKHGVHLDLYRFFNNRSIQVYLYNNKYSEHTLNGISEAILGKSKIEFEGNVGDLSLLELSDYCLNDSQLTYELTSLSSSLMMKILLVTSRIAKMPMNDVARLGVSNWIRSMLFYEHRRIGALIPRPDELVLKGGASSEATIKGKKYKGGLVIEPKPGVHFGVSVLDFASLYPSIIKVHNLSYETVNCPHEECRANRVPDTEHWVCTKRRGITSLVMGSLRDLRVSHYKHLAKDKSIEKDERDLYAVVSQGLKVILNAGYGVMGFETFALYCLPVAEATAAYGRFAITKTIEKCEQEGIAVIYSDTDSLFIENPDKDKIDRVIKWADAELGVELDVDKVYRYVAFSQRKKNYFGVLEDGTADIKGLTGKKSQTPEFLKKTFNEVLDTLGQVHSQSDFDYAKTKLKTILTETMLNLRNGKIPIRELAFEVMLGKSIDGYKTTKGNGKTKSDRKQIGSPKGKQGARAEESSANQGVLAGGAPGVSISPGLPQHVRAAEFLKNRGKVVKAGDIISYVKTKSASGVKPAEFARQDEIDVDKYVEYASSMFDQILDSLDVTFDEIVGKSSLDAFWS